jgi:hypothetical protein
MAVTNQIPDVAAEWVKAVKAETGRSTIFNYMLDIEWRKHRKFPRIPNSLWRHMIFLTGIGPKPSMYL